MRVFTKLLSIIIVMDEQKTSTKVRPTKRQRELLTFVEQFIEANGYSPSYREIMQGLNYTSVATVALHVNNLIKRGHLAKRDHSARSLEVLASSSSGASKITLKQLKASEEKWLVEKIELFFKEAEAAPKIHDGELDKLYVLIGALKILGSPGAAQSFTARLAELKKRASSNKYAT